MCVQRYTKDKCVLEWITYFFDMKWQLLHDLWISVEYRMNYIGGSKVVALLRQVWVNKGTIGYNYRSLSVRFVERKIDEGFLNAPKTPHLRIFIAIIVICCSTCFRSLYHWENPRKTSKCMKIDKNKGSKHTKQWHHIYFSFPSIRQTNRISLLLFILLFYLSSVCNAFHMR